MTPGDIVWITARSDPEKHGCGLYLGTGHRGTGWRGVGRQTVYSFFWKGRFATFDREYWYFEVINEGR